MEFQNFLKEAIEKRFSADATVKALEEKVKTIAEHLIMAEYKDKILFNDGLQFKLVGVKANFWNTTESLTLSKVDVVLAYFCVSKLPKAKREKLAEAKDNYERNGWLFYNNYKVPIWKDLRYSIGIEQVLSGNINLDIS